MVEEQIAVKNSRKHNVEEPTQLNYYFKKYESQLEDELMDFMSMNMTNQEVHVSLISVVG